MLFSRKVLLVALMAVALLGSSVNAGADAAGRHLPRHRPTEISQAQEEADIVLWGMGCPACVLDKMASGISPAQQATPKSRAMDAKEILEVGIPKLL